MELYEASIAPGFCGYQLPVKVVEARSVVSLGESNFLALERKTNSVVYFYDSDQDGLADSRRNVAKADRLNHGLAIHGDYVYASSDVHVYRWKINNGSDFLIVVESQELVIDNINADGMGGAPHGHTTRTLAFDDQGRLYVSVGSNANVDPDSYRSRIRRFTLDSVELPIDFQVGEVFADGLRNEVGLAFDRHGDLWGVENSADKLVRDDIGGDIHEDNPAEELNRFKEEDKGKHWGYPQCWTEFLVPPPHGEGQGTIWAWPSFLEAGAISDEACRADTIPPVVALQGHSAPLGITFYEWKNESQLSPNCPPSTAFPQEMDGYAFIAYHGSWNRDTPTGYKVVYVEMDEAGEPIGNTPIDLLAHVAPDAKWPSGLRPVDVAFDDCSRLLVTSDGTDSKGSMVLRIESTDINGTCYTNITSSAHAPTNWQRKTWAFLVLLTCAASTFAGW
ncbi:Inherit from COG: Dehydrogenase [Seminavis robusta]|uniref:Inherit from COG: Dehydrogenase n=1 Tax=Seminavis robusta TaxID=568900 RepID=A0A9N8E6R1_9STRA|nr:Inherit from COG: Dehydrogenase [Seminavis robusta]|eukprot:Sro734_g194670.1 Inherit from COG: Dehydrogenase (449) ;mRNA; r:19899-21407